jgi:phage shock protein A
MGIFKRLQDIVSANFNDMIEEWEDPEAMLRQAVREMETAIGESKREVARAMASEKLVLRDLEDNRRQARDWQARAEKAVHARDDSLARRALARRQECDKVVAALEDQAHATGEASQLLRRQLAAMQAKLNEAKRRLGTLTARVKAAEVRAKVQAASGDVHLDQAAFEKFDRLRARVERVEAEAEAMRELECGPHSDSPTGDVPLDDGELGLDAELDALKRKLGS